MDAVWKRVDLSNPESRQRATIFAEAVMAEAGETHLLSNLDWALCGSSVSDNLLFYAFDHGDDGRGFALLRIQQRPLKFLLGELTLFKVGLTRFDLWQHPVIAIKNGDQAGWSKAVSTLVTKILEDLPAKTAFGIEGVAAGGAFIRQLYERQDLLTLELGPPFKHQFIQMPDSFEQYLAGLGRKSRTTTLYSRRRLAREHDVKMVRFHQQNDFERFLDDAIAISKKTYQWRLLGLGLRNRQALGRRLLFAAKKGWLCSYILYCADNPVAFMLGYIYRDCYYYIDVGFDPDWQKFSVGSVLQLNVIEELYSWEQPPKLFDFAIGYGEHKARFGNHEMEELNILLLPKSTSNQILLATYKTVDLLTETAVSVLDKLGLKQKIKKLIRNSGGVTALLGLKRP